MTARASTFSRRNIAGLRRTVAARGRAAACRGITLVGLVFWAALISITAVVALRVIPVVNENYTISRAVSRVAHENANTVNEVRQAFDRVKQVEYAISSISGKDLEVSKENDRIVVSYAYDKEIELFGPVYLLIKFRGRSS